MLGTLVLASAFVASGANACKEPPRIASGVSALHGEIVEAESFTLAELQDMAQRSGAVLCCAVLLHTPLGFYTASFGHDYQVRSETQTSDDGTRCGTLTTITVRLMLVNRAVVVARDLRERGCDRDAVARHYTKHALADDQALSRHVPILHQALVAAWPAIRERLASSGPTDEASLRQVIEPVVAQLVDVAEKDRMASIAAVDSGGEVLALTSACMTRL